MILVGLDLGKVRDPSALTVITRRDVPIKPLPDLPTKPQEYGPPKPDPNVDWDRPVPHPRDQAEQRYRKDMDRFIAGEAGFDAPVVEAVPAVQTERRYLVRLMRKWPLGTSYVKVVQEVRLLCGQQRLQVDTDGKIRPPTLVVDASGLGAPVIDMFRTARVPAMLIAVNIHGGEIVRCDPEHPWHWYVPKNILVSTMQVLLQTGRLDTPKGLKDPLTGEDLSAAMNKEMLDFRYDQDKETGHISLEAEEGSKDDLLLSACYALWYGERGGKIPRIW